MLHGKRGLPANCMQGRIQEFAKRGHTGRSAKHELSMGVWGHVPLHENLKMQRSDLNLVIILTEIC